MDGGEDEAPGVPDGLRRQAAGLQVDLRLDSDIGQVTDAERHKSLEVTPAVPLILPDGLRGENGAVGRDIVIDGLPDGEQVGHTAFLDAHFQLTGAVGGEAVGLPFRIGGEGLIDALAVCVLADVELIPPFSRWEFSGF